MKSSKYNFLFNIDEDKFLGFNSFSTALFEVNKKEAEKIKEILKSPQRYMRDPIFRTLAEAGFIIEDQDDELKYLEESFREGKDSKEFFNLTIAPTLSCNFKCDYCFEECPNSQMKEEVKARLFQIVEEKIPTLSQLSVAWFGGEPLLAMNTIREFSTKFMKLCTRNKVKYSSTISTNGYLLDFDTARELKSLFVNSAQITIDGPKEIHDQRRPSKDGRSSFDRIMKNLKEVLNLIQISIRINLDKRNLPYIPKLLDILAKEEIIPSAHFYFGHVKAINDDREIASHCLSNEEYAIAVKKLYQYVVEKEYGMPEFPEVLLGGYCGSCARETIVVDPNGKVFKCWADIGSDDENAIGDIFRDDFIRGLPEAQKRKCQQKHDRYLKWNPFTNEACLKCKTLPLCMGGCPVLGIANNDTKSCTSWRYNLKDILYLHYQMQTKYQKER